jgi:3-phenylpropionate/cinnamic acid dioxygenase small subunit
MVQPVEVSGWAPADSRLYCDIQQFYSYQSNLLDSGKSQEWAQTFTEDGVFAANGAPQPSVGRSGIEAAARRTVEDLRARGLVRRHWLGMVRVAPQDSGIVRASCYALITETPHAGTTRLLMSTTCDDELVAVGDGFLVQHREVRRDDLIVNNFAVEKFTGAQ